MELLTKQVNIKSKSSVFFFKLSRVMVEGCNAKFKEVIVIAVRILTRTKYTS